MKRIQIIIDCVLAAAVVALFILHFVAPKQVKTEEVQISGAGRPKRTGNRNGCCREDIEIVRVVAAAPGPPSVLLTIRMYGGAGAAATWDFEFRTSFSRGNVCFILAVTFRARLFLFPVPSSPRQIRIYLTARSLPPISMASETWCCIGMGFVNMEYYVYVNLAKRLLTLPLYHAIIPPTVEEE